MEITISLTRQQRKSLDALLQETKPDWKGTDIGWVTALRFDVSHVQSEDELSC